MDQSVALRKESVDRNHAVKIIVIVMHVALRKESVDRNTAWKRYPVILGRSLSARRAWIEILRRGSIRRYLGGRSPQGERG